MSWKRILIAIIVLLSASRVGVAENTDRIIGDKDKIPEKVLRSRYENFTTAQTYILVFIESKELGRKATIVCGNRRWHRILTERTNYFRGNEQQYVDFMLKNHDRWFDLPMNVFDELVKDYDAPKSDAYEKDKIKGVPYIANKYLEKKCSGNNCSYSFHDDKYSWRDRSLLRMLLESGLVVSCGCEDFRLWINAEEVDAIHK